MGAPDLTYDPDRLQTLGSQLSTIASNLKDDKKLTHYDIEDVAHRDVEHAIDDFVGDWDDKRNKLVEKVEALADMATKSAEQFNEADLELARALTSEEA